MNSDRGKLSKGNHSDISPGSSRGSGRFGEKLPLGLCASGVLLVVFASSATGQRLLVGLSALVNQVVPFLVPFLTSHVLEELGIALVIVGLVTLILERPRVHTFSDQLSEAVRDKLEQIEEATKDAIVRGPLPRSYYEHVSGIMLLNRFLRYEWVVRMGFSWADADHDFLTFAFEQEYKVKNLHAMEQQYSVDHFESIEWDDKFPGSTRIRYVRIKYEDSDEWIAKDVAEHDKTLGEWKNGETIRFRKPVALLPGRVMVVQEGSVKVVRDRQFDWIIIGEPTMGVRCWIVCPTDLQVALEWPETLLGSKACFAKAGEERLEGDDTQAYWEFPYPMPPYSYFIIKWRKKKGVAPVKPADPGVPKAVGNT